MKALAAAVLIGAVAVAAVAASGAALDRIEAGRGPAHHLLYLPNGRYLKVASLGQAPVLADLIYLWSIQYYANFQVEDRYSYVDTIYDSVLTELDPHYFDPYWLGALILSVEAGSLDKALALLDKGFRNNPDKWVFPYLAGWECAYARRFDCAIERFETAASVPSAPPDVARLAAGMYQRQGDKKTALAEWRRLAREAADPGVRKVAENRARALRVDLDIEMLNGAVASFRQRHGRPPSRLGELAGEGLIGSVPQTPDGAEYEYDPSTGTVTSGPPRVIPH